MVATRSGKLVKTKSQNKEDIHKEEPERRLSSFNGDQRQNLDHGSPSAGCSHLSVFSSGAKSALDRSIEFCSLINDVFSSLPFTVNRKTLTDLKHHRLETIPFTIPVEGDKDSPENLSSSLQCDIKNDELYFEVNMKSFEPVRVLQDIDGTEDLLKKSILYQKDSAPIVKESLRQSKKKRQEKQRETAGKGWFNLPKTEITPEIKRDFQIMQMRDVLDPHRHYKKDRKRKFPKYFQIGTVVSDSTEFYSSRLSKKNRHQTMVDGLLADAEFRKRNKRKYLEFQAKRQINKKGFHKHKLERKKSSWNKRKV